MKNIALIAGGYTGESVISMKSAEMIAGNIDRSLYRVYHIFIDEHAWVCRLDDGAEVPVDKNDFSIQADGRHVTFDMAFIIIHGSPGEDGKLQGYFDMLKIPYNTCNAMSSAITMNKSYTKAIVDGIEDLHIARSVQLFKQAGDHLKMISGLRLPLFVKTNSGGSSLGMSKVSRMEDIPGALARAFKEDEQVIVEEFIKGREFTVGIVRLDGKILVLPITEIISTKEFFDYEAKYTPGVTNEVTPADLPEELVERVGRIVTDIYERLDCSGVVRIDFILPDPDRDFYFLEVNTVPGQSENSLIPQQVRAMGWKTSDFYGKLIEESLRG
jgi:D-alanine-D-alanine ligase